jgi:NH3-dependent NAD+ synthetase
MNIDLGINTDLAQTILTGFIRSEVTRAGYTRAVVGLSGGIDSALSCMLAVGALGRENVLAVRMPYKSSSADSLEHAELPARPSTSRRWSNRCLCATPESPNCEKGISWRVSA